MNRENIIKAAVCGLAGSVSALASATQKTHPNVVVIICDAMQQARLDGGTAVTPSIQRLKDNGYSYTQAYCAFPLSTPARFSLFTGMYPADCNIRFNLENRPERFSAVNWEKAEAAQATGLGNLFKKAGYDTFYGGTTSLASRRSISDPYPYGFDNYYSPQRHDQLGRDAAEVIRSRKSDDNPYLLVLSFINPHNIGQFQDYLNRESLTPEYITPKKKEGIDRITTHMKKLDGVSEEQRLAEHYPALPFNLEQAVGEPEGLPSHISDYTDEQWRMFLWVYDRLIEEVDYNMSPVVDALMEEDRLDNTIVVFLSDHGEMAAAHRREHKSVPYQEAQKVPLIFAGNGISKGIEDKSNVFHTGLDFLPTLCGLAGIEIPEEKEGLSAADLMRGVTEKLDRKYTFYEGENWFQVLEDGRYKLTILQKPGAPVMLFDLKKDPGEMVNLADSKKHASIRKRLEGILIEKIQSRGLSIMD